MCIWMTAQVWYVCKTSAFIPFLMVFQHSLKFYPITRVLGLTHIMLSQFVPYYLQIEI